MGITSRKMIAVLSTRSIQRFDAAGNITELKGSSLLKAGDTITLNTPKAIANVKWKVLSAPVFVSHHYTSRKGKHVQNGWSVNLEEVIG